MNLRESFENFDNQNPQMWELFKRFALQAISTGKRSLSIALITERIRWEVDVESVGDRFKLNNNHKAFYARKFHEEFPDYGEVFATREQRYSAV